MRQKIADQVRQQLSQVTDDAGSAQDLLSLMASMGSRDASARGKGSRFVYSEKLQFAQVRRRLLAVYINNIASFFIDSLSNSLIF